ncbi:DUF4160 domain-containing protein [Aliiroseovarius marinus]|uniref:DUF4160 domain-containing protein n=1 Tax=Aliiroseovarius marinus TaxID=2500159 RepID=UPI003D7E83F0
MKQFFTQGTRQMESRMHFDVPASIVALLDHGLCAEYGEKLEKHLVEQKLGAKFQIYSDEHAPPHFHVSKNGDEASFDIRTGEVLKYSGNPKKICKVVKMVFPSLRPKLVNVWNETRPSDCQVGAIDQDTLPQLDG